ncbi:hypothetical protein [Curtobacterium ammoniigenes]|uniref:hypothetical protein n=1 Tax=Curtobacterium ammoniigenes TaxID=395387 RepID=UPI0008321E54|nr:hypothetical protein [Curtobacterium ammoniigenes]
MKAFQVTLSWIMLGFEVLAIFIGVTMIVNSGGGDRGFGIFLVIVAGIALLANIYRVIYRLTRSRS